MAVKGQAVSVEGLRELRRFLAGLPDKTATDGLKKIHAKVAEPVKDEGVRRVPRKSGDLGKSIRTAKASARAATVRAGGARVPYAGPIHFGWPNRRVVFGKPTSGPSPIRAQPFLSDALRAKQPEVLDMYQRELEEFVGWLMDHYQLPR